MTNLNVCPQCNRHVPEDRRCPVCAGREDGLAEPVRLELQRLRKENDALRIGYDGDLIDWLDECAAGESALLERVVDLEDMIGELRKLLDESSFYVGITRARPKPGLVERVKKALR
jgi:hypothetical protein